MGYELDKLMRQFGVNSPSLSYDGAQAGTPDFQKDKAAFDQYASKYMGQMGHGVMYAQPQFGQPSLNPAMLEQPSYAAATPNPATSMPTMPTLQPPVTQPQQDVGTMPRPGGAKRDEYSEGVINYADGGLAELAGQYDADPSVVSNPFFGDGGVPAEMPPAVAQQPAPGKMDLQSMVAKYMTPTSAYGDELGKARATANKETEAFNSMLQRTMDNQSDTTPSKAEMYFRLAAAFGAPTRTGNFGETLGKVGETLGQYSKETREAARNKAAATLQLGLQGQQARMQGAKDDVTTLRTLAGKELEEKRMLAAEMLKHNAKLMDPQSPAGKQAKDEGYDIGTPEYRERVVQIHQENAGKIDAQTAAALAAAAAATGHLGVAQERLALEKEKEANKGDAASKPLPTQALKMQQEELSLLGTVGGVQNALSDIQNKIEKGKLSFGPVTNKINDLRNASNMSNEESRNFSSFKSTMEKLRNDSLRLNTGVQTEGDAQRAWNELFANINDNEVVKQRLKEIVGINSRAAKLRKMNIDGIRANYGKEPLETSEYEAAAPVKAAPTGSQGVKKYNPATGRIE